MTTIIGGTLTAGEVRAAWDDGVDDRSVRWLLALVAASAAGALAAPAGVAFDGIVLVAMAAATRDRGVRGVVATVLLLVPLLRLLWAGLSMRDIPPIGLTPTIGLTFIVASWFVARSLELDRSALGLGRPTDLRPLVVVVALFGVGGVLAALLVGDLLTAASLGDTPALLLPAFALIAALGEEIAFRGLPLAALEGVAIRRLVLVMLAVSMLLAFTAAPIPVAIVLALSSVGSMLALGLTGSLWGPVAGRTLFLVVWSIGLPFLA